jgi:anti-sigma B factor antagonist
LSTSADLDFDRKGQAVVAHLSGEVDMTNSGYVGQELTESVPNDAEALVVDLSDTRYLDSAAIELLFDLSRRLGRRRQRLSLVLPGDSPLRRVLTLTGIETAAPVHESVEAALAE